MALSKTAMYGIGAMTLMVGGMVTYMAVTSSSNKTSIGVPIPAITINNEGAKPLTFQMSAATVDICYVKAPSLHTERNLTDPTFLENLKALGLTRVLNFADGSISNLCYPSITTPTTGHGYNARVTDFTSQKEFDEYGNGVFKDQTKWASDFLTKTLELTRTMGWKSDAVLNKKNTWAENKFIIDNSTGEYIKLCSEVVTTSWGWQDYLNWANRTKDSIKKYYGLYSETTTSGKKVIIDEPVLYKFNKQSTDWRANINPASIPGVYGADVYWQIDDQVSFTANQDSNLIKSKLFFDSIVPAQIAQFQTEFPGWKIIAGEFQIEDNREGNTIYVRDNMVEAFTFAGFFKMFIANQDVQPMGIYMSLRGLIDPANVKTQSFTILNKLLNPAYNVSTLTLTAMDGCDGVVLNNDKDYLMMIRNTSHSTYTLSSVKIKTKTKTPAVWKIQRQYASDLSGAVTRDSVSSSTLTILPVSLNVISFNTATTLTSSVK